MAKADWNFFEYNAPGDQVFNGVQTATEVSPGGDTTALKLTYGAWTGGSPNPVMGYMYNGPDIGEFPLLEGQISAAIRSNYSGPLLTGVILRSQINLNGVISDPNDLNFYMAGVEMDATTDNNAYWAMYKIVNGVASKIAGTFIYNVVDYSTYYTQFEMRLINNGGNVETYTRRNNGTQLTLPGSPGWTNFGLTDIDSSPGVLYNAGYWGFGIMARTSGAYISNGHYWDRVSITQELID